jgi:hypothetical protein
LHSGFLSVKKERKQEEDQEEHLVMTDPFEVLPAEVYLHIASVLFLFFAIMTPNGPCLHL